MQTFKDKHGREWRLNFSLGSVARVKERSDGEYNLMGDAAKLAPVLWDDLTKFYEAAWYFIEPQAEAVDVTPLEFAQALCGDDILVEARRVFFVEWRKLLVSLEKDAIVLTLDKLLRINNRMAAEAIKDMGTLKHATPENKQDIRKAIALIFGNET